MSLKKVNELLGKTELTEAFKETLKSKDLSEEDGFTIKAQLYEEIEKLGERDKKIMIMRYGLYNSEEMTQKDVAKLLGISQSYISRIEKKVIRRLKLLDK